MTTNKDWWKKAVIYQIYPQSFKDSNGDGVGDLNGIKEELPYLKKLGVDVLWLNPIYQSPMADNGYDISDYETLNPDYGTMADFDTLLAAAHQVGIKIIMDLVLSVTSDEHRWFQASRKSKDNPYSDYYVWQDPKPDGSAPNNWGSIFGGGSAWEYVPERKQYYLHMFSVKQPYLNWENPALRADLFDMMRFWLDKGIDGFRLDSISLISVDPTFPDDPNAKPGTLGSPYIGISNGPKLHEYLRAINEVLSPYDVMTVGEATRTSVEDGLKYSDPKRHELNMVFQFDHVHVDYGKYGRYSDVRFKLSELRQAMATWQEKLNGHGWNSLYWDNHDQPRAVSRFGNDSPEYRELSAKMLATVLHFQQGTPFVFEGEELGMTNVAFDTIDQYKDVEAKNMYHQFRELGFSDSESLNFLHRKSRDNARTPMPWRDAPQAGFTTGKPWIELNPNYPQINVAESLERPDSVFYYYQKLINLRHTMPIITDGVFSLVNGEDSDVFSYTRQANGETLLVVASFSQAKVRFTLPDNLPAGILNHVLLSNYPDAFSSKDATIYLRPYEAVVFHINN